MEYRRGGAREQAVALGGLREVRDLGRAAEVRDGRQQVVLHDGAQSDVGAEAFRLLKRERRQFVRSPDVDCPTRAVASVFGARECAARAVVE